MVENKPIKHTYQGKEYTLRHKSPEEWEEFGRLNNKNGKGIEPEFWDSPIISKDRTDFSNGPIVSSKKGWLGKDRTIKSSDDKSQKKRLTGRQGRLSRKEPPVTSAQKYQQDHTAKRLRERKRLGGVKREAAKNLRPNRLSGIKKSQPRQALQKKIGPAKIRSGKKAKLFLNDMTNKPGTFWAYLAASSLTWGFWAGIQLPLLLYSIVFFVSGAMSIGILSPIIALGAKLGIDTSIILIIFSGGGFALAAFNAVIGSAILGGVLFIFAISGIKSLSSEYGDATTKWSLFLLAVMGTIAPFWCWSKWWIDYVTNNPD